MCIPVCVYRGFIPLLTVCAADTCVCLQEFHLRYVPIHIRQLPSNYQAPPTRDGIGRMFVMQQTGAFLRLSLVHCTFKEKILSNAVD